MRPAIAYAFSGLVCSAAIAVIAAQTPSQHPPQFRAGVDVVELDVSVFDKDHNPIKGLTSADFTLLEDKLPRPLVGFAEVDEPDPPAPSAAWMRDASEDVAANDVKDRRLFVLVVDDASFAFYPGPQLERFVRRARELAQTFIRHLGPTDLAAVVFTGDNRRSQDFTNDHGRLLAAVQKISAPKMPGCLQQIYSVDTLRKAADYLIRVPGRRKAFVDLTAFPHPMSSPGGRMEAQSCLGYAMTQTYRIFEAAQRANVTVSTIWPGARTLDSTAWEGSWFQRVPHETGGEALVGGTDAKAAEAALSRVFQLNSSYYLLGYSSADLKKFHFIKVLVNRPDAEVRTRDKYYVPAKEEEAKGPAAPPALKAMADLLPMSEIPLRASLAPFAAISGTGSASAQGPGASIAVVLSVRQPQIKARTTPAKETLDLRIGTFTPEGDARGSIVRTVPLTLPAGIADLQYEVLARVDVPKPGLYELRVAAHSALNNADGSVYVTIEVPDFAKEPVSLSGIVVSAGGDLAVNGQETLASLLPVTPTTVRAFGHGERVTAFLRAYEGGGNPIQPLTMHTLIVNDHDQPVVDRTEVVGVNRFGASRSAALSLPLAIDTLARGPYLLTVEIAVGKSTARRELRFTVK